LGKVDSGGTYCTAQGALQQIGDAGTSISAFLVVLLVVAQYHRIDWIVSNPRTVSFVMLGFLVTFLFLLIAPPAISIRSYYGNTGLWCWIAHRNPETDRLQIASAYALDWLASLSSVLGYGYVLLGTLKHSGRTDRNHSPQEDDILTGDNVDVFTIKEAKGMMWYSLAYCIEVIPISVVRLVQFGAKGPCPNVRPGWIIFAVSLLGASGFINAMLWMTTGRRFGFRSHREIEEAVIMGERSPLSPREVTP